MRKYDPILDDFLQDEGKLAIVEIENIEVNYLRTQLMKRIIARKIVDKIKVSTISDKLILEKN